MDHRKSGYATNYSGKITGIELPNYTVVNRKILAESKLFSGRIEGSQDLKIVVQISSILDQSALSSLLHFVGISLGST